jgi:retinol dehydrogenase 12
MGQLSFLNFIQDQFWKVEPVVHVDLTGKTVVVVGANVGLGFEAAKHFASMNPNKLVLACRSQQKGQAAVDGKSATLD